jgi:hypothetical protein
LEKRERVDKEGPSIGNDLSPISESETRYITEGRTNAVNNSVYGEVDTAREAWAVIITGTKLHKRIARVSPSSTDKGSSVNRDNSGTTGNESTSALAPKYNRGTPPETKKVGCKPSHGAVGKKTKPVRRNRSGANARSKEEESIAQPSDPQVDARERDKQILERTDDGLPTENHHETRGKVAHATPRL